jgi:hypothetical protein
MSYRPCDPVPSDAETVRQFLEIISAQAKHACKDEGGKELAGVLQISRVHPSNDELAVSGRFEMGDVDHMVATALADANAGLNSYVEARIIKRDTHRKARGDAKATVGVFALVADNDADKGKMQKRVLPPSMVTETSPGNSHDWFFLEKALSNGDAKQLGEGMRALGGDADTGNPTQPYRIAGTANYPNASKQERGRFEVHATRVLECSGKRYTAAQLRAVFPLPEKAQTNSSQDNCDGVGDWYDAAKKLPDNLRALIKDGPQQPDADRSKVFHSVVGQLKRLGWSADNIFQLLNKFPSGIALKYASTGRLQKNVGSSFGKCDAPPPGLPDHDTCCPAHDDGTPSLSIRDARGKVLVHCHADCDQAEVIAALRSRRLWEGGHRSFMRPAQHKAGNAQPGRDDMKRRAGALAIWQATKSARNTLVETYLNARGLSLQPPPTLRFHPGLKHPSGATWPAMVALVTRGRESVAVHRTFLTRDGRAKAPVKPQKMLLGPCRGGVVRLAPPR